MAGFCESYRQAYGSYLGVISPAPDNLINRDFQAATPNEKWLTDITDFQIPAGKVYLSPMIDCFDGLVSTIEQFIQVVDSYIRWYNEKRIKISIDSLSPLEYRESIGFAA